MAFKICDAVSLDLETQGTDPGDVILSIGMTAFNIATGEIGDRIFVSFDPQEWLDRGYTQRQSTMDWWADTERDEARKFLSCNRIGLGQGLSDVLGWLRAANTSRGLWSRGYMDETMLRMAMRKELGIEDPWHYRAPHDARTIFMLLDAMAPNSGIWDVPFVGVPHHALDDAIHEAKLVHRATSIMAQALNK